MSTLVNEQNKAAAPREAASRKEMSQTDMTETLFHTRRLTARHFPWHHNFVESMICSRCDATQALSATRKQWR